MGGHNDTAPASRGTRTNAARDRHHADALPCGSRSTIPAESPRQTAVAYRVVARVVFPQPPLFCTTDTTNGIVIPGESPPAPGILAGVSSPTETPSDAPPTGHSIGCRGPCARHVRRHVKYPHRHRRRCARRHPVRPPFRTDTTSCSRSGCFPDLQTGRRSVQRERNGAAGVEYHRREATRNVLHAGTD